MTAIQCRKLVVQVLVIRASGSDLAHQSGYRSGDLGRYDTPMWEVNISDPGCQRGNRSGDL